jgi:hypothetical protein
MEVEAHDEALEDDYQRRCPDVARGPSESTLIPLLNADRRRRQPAARPPEPALAKLCGASPIPASSGVTNPHRLLRGGHRQANAALYRIVIVRMRWHQPTIDHVARRSAQGLSKKDIIPLPETLRCTRNPSRASQRPARVRGSRASCVTTLLTHRGVNALAKSVIGLFSKTEVIQRNGPGGILSGRICHDRV